MARIPPRRWIPALAGMMALAGASGCSLFGSGPDAAGADAETPVAAKSGLALEAERLLDTDRKFAARSLEVGSSAAAREFFAVNGTRLLPAGEPAVGPDKVGESLGAEGSRILSWEPRYAEVFAPGDWGWSWGDWQAHEPGAGGRRLAQGRYVTLWKKQPDGSWKVRMDTGSAAAGD